MSLTPCRECKKDISSQAVVCPHCGLPLQEQVDWGRLFLGLFAGPPLIAVGLSFFLSGTGLSAWEVMLFFYVLAAAGLVIKGLPKK